MVRSIRRRFECRAEGRTISGTVLHFGDVSPSHRERFERRSVQFADTVHLDLGHDPLKTAAWYPGGGMQLQADDNSIRMTAELPPIPPADAVLEAVKAAGGRMGLSVEFRAERERMDGDIRVIERALLAGIGVVRNPSYPRSRVETRGANGEIPYRTALPCVCHKGTCDKVEIQKIEIPRDRDVLAVAGDYKRAVGSMKRGSLVLDELDDGMSVSLSDEALATNAGRDLVAMAAVVPIFARPIFDQEESDLTERGDTAVYHSMKLKAVLFGPTDNGEGWPEVQFPAPGDRAENRQDRRRRRRVWL